MVEVMGPDMREAVCVIRWFHSTRTILQVHQMVFHGQFNSNGHKVDIPSCQVKPGTVHLPSKIDMAKVIELYTR